MATAKQIAARKRFAAMAKSGKLATLRKNAKPAEKAAKRVAKADRDDYEDNPAPKKKVQTKRGGCNPIYAVQIKRGNRWVTVASHTSQGAAESAAKLIHASGVKSPIRVWG